MIGLSPFLTKWLSGKFNKDCSVVKANEFFVSEAYNTLARNVYDMLFGVTGFNKVFDPSTPEVSARIYSYNNATNQAEGRRHNLRDTWLALEDVENYGHRFFKVKQVDRRFFNDPRSNPDYENTDPIYIVYGFGDLSMSNPYAFAAVDLTEGSEQYLLIEYIKDSLIGNRKYSSAIDLILRFHNESDFNTVLEIQSGDSYTEVMSDETYQRRTRFTVHFGADITVENLINALNALVIGGEQVFRAGYRGGLGAPSQRLIDIFNYYDGPVLKTATKVLKFVPPFPAVKINDPANFFNKYFNNADPAEGGFFNIFRYVTGELPKTFVNTGTYGFLLRKQYDEAGALMFPSMVTFEDIKSFTYIPNKKQFDHYTKTGTGTPWWFDSYNAVISDNYASSIDMDGNKLFLPFVEVTDAHIRFVNGRTVFIDNVQGLEVLNISVGGEYIPELIESNIRYDSNAVTLSDGRYASLSRIFNVVKGFLGYTPDIMLSDTENALVRTSEFFRGITWYLNKVVIIDQALDTEAAPELNIYSSLLQAQAYGALTKGKTVIIINGRSQAEWGNIDRYRLRPLEIPENMEEGLEFRALAPAQTLGNLTILDSEFTFEGAKHNPLLLELMRNVPHTELNGQDFSGVHELIISIKDRPGTTYTFDNCTLSNCKFDKLQIFREGKDGEIVFISKVYVDSTCSAKNVKIGGRASLDFTPGEYNARFGEDYPVDTWNIPSFLTAVVGQSDETEEVLNNLELGTTRRRFITVDSDLPDCLSAVVYPSYIQNASLKIPSLHLMGKENSRRSAITFTPFPMHAVPPDAQDYMTTYGFDKNILALDGDGRISWEFPVMENTVRKGMDINLKIVFATGDSYIRAPELRNKAEMSSLIKVVSNVHRSTLDILIDDQPVEGTGESRFTKLEFLEGPTAFGNTFLFMDCGLSVQPELTPPDEYEDRRGGLLHSTNINVSFTEESVRRADGSMGFFASDMFQRTPYVFYFADQHPAYSVTTRHRSRDVNIRFQTPSIPIPEDDFVPVDVPRTAYPAPVYFRPEWSVDLDNPGNSYPQVQPVTTSFQSIVPDPLGWIGSFTAFAGLNGGSIFIDTLKVRTYSIGLFKVPDNPPAPPHSAANVFEDVSSLNIDINRVNTLWSGEDVVFPLERKTLRRGFNFLTISNTYCENLNSNTTLKVELWLTRSPIAGIIGGTNLTVKIGYRYLTEGLDGEGAGFLRRAVRPGGGTVAWFPALPLFQVAGVRASNIHFHIAENQFGPLSTWVVGEIDPGQLKNHIESYIHKVSTPDFFPLNGLEPDPGPGKQRPMRVVIGGFASHRGRGQTEPMSLMFSSNGNKLNVHCTRLNLLAGANNYTSGLCYDILAGYIHGGSPPYQVCTNFIKEIHAPDTFYCRYDTNFPDESPNYLDFLSLSNIAGTAAYTIQTIETLAQASPDSWVSPGDTNRRHVVLDMLSTLNPCQLFVIPVYAWEEVEKNLNGKIAADVVSPAEWIP